MRYTCEFCNKNHSTLEEATQCEQKCFLTEVKEASERFTNVINKAEQMGMPVVIASSTDYAPRVRPGVTSAKSYTKYGDVYENACYISVDSPYPTATKLAHYDKIIIKFSKGYLFDSTTADGKKNKVAISAIKRYGEKEGEKLIMIDKYSKMHNSVDLWSTVNDHEDWKQEKEGK